MFISFEGVDGSGKTTQIKLTKEWLDSLGVKSIVTREPGGTPVGSEIRHVLLSNHINASSALLLFLADRVQHYLDVIKPSIDFNKVVLCDRSVDSSRVYQCFVGEVPEEVLDIFESTLHVVKPDLTILLDLPVTIAKGRLVEKDVYNSKELSFHSAIRSGYLQIADREPNRIKVIDANASGDIVQERIREQLNQVLKYNA